MASLDVGALKLQFNNDVLKIKKYIAQAKTHVIHKLTRDVGKLKKRKGTDEELKKFGAKADSIVSEIMFVKKIHHSELSQFGMRNFNILSKIMDTPIVTKEKAMAKLLSNKCLKPKFQEIFNQFSIIPLETLFQVNPIKIQRKERKMKAKLAEQSAKDSSQNEPFKKKNKPSHKIQEISLDIDREDEDLEENENNVSASKRSKNSDFIVTDIEQNTDNKYDSAHSEEEEDEVSDQESILESDISVLKNKKSFKGYQRVSESEDQDTENDDEVNYDEEDVVSASDVEKSKSKSVIPKLKKAKLDTIEEWNEGDIIPESQESKNSKPNRKPRRMYVDLKDNEMESMKTEKTVDSFFVTESGDNYLTLAIPRKPDPRPSDPEATMVNRKMRRAAYFGNEVLPKKIKKQSNSYKNELFRKHENEVYPRNESNKRKHFEGRPNKTELPHKEEEKLHPSWEAKKKKSSLVAFQGKKVVFDN